MKQVGLFGKRKSGKSTLMYALSQRRQLQVMLVDTMGFDVKDTSAKLSGQSVKVALILIADEAFEMELAWAATLKASGTKVYLIVSQADKFKDEGLELQAALAEAWGEEILRVSAKSGAGVDELIRKIAEAIS